MTQRRRLSTPFICAANAHAINHPLGLTCKSAASTHWRRATRRVSTSIIYRCPYRENSSPSYTEFSLLPLREVPQVGEGVVAGAVDSALGNSVRPALHCPETNTIFHHDVPSYRSSKYRPSQHLVQSKDGGRHKDFKRKRSQKGSTSCCAGSWVSSRLY